MKIPQEITNAAVAMLNQYVPKLSADGLVDFLRNIDERTATQKPLKPMTRQEVCDYLSISLSSVNRYMKDGRLKAIHIGPRLVRVDPSSVQNLIGK